MEKEKKEKIKYEVFSARLHQGTRELLNKKRKQSGLSWNRFMYQLLTSEK